jgi:HTH-type transcriptional regulator/antitoxin HigA
VEIKPIKNKRDYRRTFKEVEGLMLAKRNTPQDDPIGAIKYHINQSGLGPHDLIPFIGGRNRVYEVLAGKWPLTLKMIRRLHNGLGIPAESLIAPGQRQAS